MMEQLDLGGTRGGDGRHRCVGDKVKVDDDPTTEEDVDMHDVTKLKVNTNGVSPPPFDAPATPKPDHRATCQYDEKCYREKVSHFRDYKHPLMMKGEMIKVRK